MRAKDSVSKKNKKKKLDVDIGFKLNRRSVGNHKQCSML